MNPPKCRVCGAAEWNHVCYGAARTASKTPITPAKSPSVKSTTAKPDKGGPVVRKPRTAQPSPTDTSPQRTDFRAAAASLDIATNRYVKKRLAGMKGTAPPSSAFFFQDRSAEADQINLLNWRTSSNVSQPDLAALLDVSRRAIQNWEADQKAGKPIPRIVALAILAISKSANSAPP